MSKTGGLRGSLEPTIENRQDIQKEIIRRAAGMVPNEMYVYSIEVYYLIYKSGLVFSFIIILSINESFVWIDPFSFCGGSSHCYVEKRRNI